MNNRPLIWIILIAFAFWLIFVVVHLLVMEPDRVMSGTALMQMYGLVLLGLLSSVTLVYIFFFRKR